MGTPRDDRPLSNGHLLARRYVLYLTTTLNGQDFVEGTFLTCNTWYRTFIVLQNLLFPPIIQWLKKQKIQGPAAGSYKEIWNCCQKKRKKKGQDVIQRMCLHFFFFLPLCSYSVFFVQPKHTFQICKKGMVKSVCVSLFDS